MRLASLVGASAGNIEAAKGPSLAKIPFHVSGHHEVEAAVFVVVEETSASGPAGCLDVRLCRDIGESAVAIVLIEDRAAEGGDEQIRKSVVIVVPRRNAHPISGSFEARFRGNVGERAVVVVSEEPVPKIRRGFVGSFSTRLRVLQRRSIHEENIRPTVVIVIKNGHTATHGLDQILPRGR